MKLLKRVSSGSQVLEIGSATGYFTKELLKKRCFVTAIEKDKKAASLAQKNKAARIINDDVLSLKKYLSREKFDFILLADVLEHLEDPLSVLMIAKKYLKNDGRLLISIPNTANFTILFNLLFGKFEYQDYGIMDRTHLRFFTKKTAEKLLDNAGLKIMFFDVVAGLEASNFYKKTIGRITFRLLPLRYLEYFLARLFPDFFALEFIYETKNR